MGFDRIHVREIGPIADPPPWPRMRAQLGRPDHEYAGVRFRDSPGLVAGSFALGFGDAVCYGTVEHDRVTVLGLTGPAAVTPPDGLVLVDWCAAS
nr:hypothetical protein GCM10020063_034930 [Dactylosporangium thailandense]